MTPDPILLVAATLRAQRDDAFDRGRPAHAEGIADAAIAISRRLREADPYFDRAVFLVAAGLPHDCRAVRDAETENR